MERGEVFGFKGALRLQRLLHRDVRDLVSWARFCQQTLVFGLLLVDLLHHVLSFILVFVQRNSLNAVRHVQALSRLDPLLTLHSRKADRELAPSQGLALHLSVELAAKVKATLHTHTRAGQGALLQVLKFMPCLGYNRAWLRSIGTVPAHDLRRHFETIVSSSTRS